MSSEYEKAVAALYQAAPEAFVAERHRLAAELKAAGDKPAAAKLAKLARPALSAWAVNQLWWHAQSDFEQLFSAAKQWRAGKLSASATHRQLMAKLTARAQALLSESGHPANDAMLRRIAMTLSGLAAAGGFEPELPGALTKDREPAGFDAFGGAGDQQTEPEAQQEQPESAAATHNNRLSKAEAAKRRAHEHQTAEKARREAAALKKREAEARAKRAAERREAAEALHTAKAELVRREADVAHAAKALAIAEKELERARAALANAEQRLATLNQD